MQTISVPAVAVETVAVAPVPFGLKDVAVYHPTITTPRIGRFDLFEQDALSRGADLTTYGLWECDVKAIYGSHYRVKFIYADRVRAFFFEKEDETYFMPVYVATGKYRRATVDAADRPTKVA